MAKMMASRGKQRTYFLSALLALVFIGPVVAAWGLYFSGYRFSTGHVNKGHLISPPLQISKLPLRTLKGKAVSKKEFTQKWSMFYVDAKICGKACENNLYKMRQVRIALGKDRNRVQRVIVTTRKRQQHLTQLLQKQYAGTQHFLAKPGQLASFIKPLPSSKMALKKGYLYIVDPLGNVMMSYAPDAKAKGLLKDIKRLLKLSRLG